MVGVLVEVEATLLEPLKVGGRFDAHGDLHVCVCVSV